MPQVSWHMWDVAIHWLIYPHCLPCFCIGLALYRGQALSYLQQLCCASVAIQHRVLLRSTAQAELHITPPIHGLLSGSAAPSLWLIRGSAIVFQLSCA